MSDSCCQDPIDTRALEKRQRRVLAVVLAINAATFVMMVAAAMLSGSSSLLSGALDNLGDAATYALSFAVVGASVAAKARVALFKGVLIMGAAIAVGGQIAWRLTNVEAPVVETMGAAAILNLAANLVCLWLLTPFRDGDVNMFSVWECSRNLLTTRYGISLPTQPVRAVACLSLGLLPVLWRWEWRKLISSGI